MELIQELTQQLGIDQHQATGGLGMLMGVAKKKLGGNFGQVAQYVPGIDNMINSAPQPQATQGGGGGGALGAIGSMLGGGQGPGGGLGSLTGLAGGFQQLGLNPAIIGRFIPIVLNFFQNKGGDETRGLLQRALA